MSSLKGISVIICCYNSASRLHETLRHIASQKIYNIPWEVIIVNNASTDNTTEVARNAYLHYFLSPVEYKVVEESNQGLTYARELGIKESKYQYIIFCDDDNWLDENYISNAFVLMESHPLIGIAGGVCTAVFEETPPSWLHQYESRLAVGKQCMITGNITEVQGYVYGAGIIIRKSALLSILNSGFKFMNSDRKKNSLSSGGDTEICFALKMRGWHIWYDEQLTFKHFIPKQRASWNYINRLNIGGARSVVILDIYKHYILNRKINYQYLFHEVAKIFKTIISPYMIKKYLISKKQVGNSFKLQYELLLQVLWETSCITVNFFEFNKIKQNLKKLSQ